MERHLFQFPCKHQSAQVWITLLELAYGSAGIQGVSFNAAMSAATELTLSGLSGSLYSNGSQIGFHGTPGVPRRTLGVLPRGENSELSLAGLARGGAFISSHVVRFPWKRNLPEKY